MHTIIIIFFAYDCCGQPFLSQSSLFKWTLNIAQNKID